MMMRLFKVPLGITTIAHMPDVQAFGTWFRDPLGNNLQSIQEVGFGADDII